MPLTLRVPLLGDCTDEASRRPAAAIESLDYEQATNQVFLRKQKRQEAGSEQRHLYGYSGSTATKVAATFLSGIAIGLSAATLQAGVSLACRYRNHLLASLFQGSGTPGSGTAVRYVADSLQGLPLVFLCMLGISVTAVWLVTLVVFYHSPKASGGGVASVMALLNGNAIDGLLSGRVYVTKLLGTATSRMAGLALGVEGPMIHLGACLASMVCHAEHVLYRRFNLHRRHPRDKAEQAPAASNDFLFSNSDHRELVSAGAAAGLAAAFGAPIGGVLFAIEEATSVWSRKLAWRCFLCASVACFTLAVLHPRSQTGMLSFRGITALTNVQWLIQLPLLTIVSACGGLLGSAFNIGKSRTLSWRKKHQGISWRLLEGASVAALTSAALIWLPAAVGSCLPLPDEWDAADVIRHNCGEGQYNDLATGLLSSSVWVIKSLLSLGSDAEPVNNRLCSIAVPCYYSALSLGVLSVTYLLLFLLASNLIVPGGLFMPCIMVGSSFGVLLGLLLRQLLPAWWSIQPGVYAVVCATAMLGAVFRSSISLVAIMIEGTRGIDMLFGIILATIVSNLVAHHVHPNGLYESELEVDSKGGTCYYLRQEPPHALRSQAAEAVMASPVVGLAPLERVSTVLSVLSGTSHNGFPVLVAAKQHHLQHQHQHQHQHQRQQHDGSTASAGRSSGMLQGLVLRSQLLVLLRHGAFCDERGRYISVPVQQSVAGFEEALGCEMEAASQASASGYRSSSSGSGPEESHGMLGELGPAPSMGIGGGGFPSLDRSRGTAAMPEADVLQAAGAAVEREVEAGRQAYLNLTPFMHLAPITVRPHTPADRVHHLFLALSLRHLCVVDWHSRCLGIITRKDLDHAAGSGWWRATHIAPTPHQSPRAGSRSVLDGSSPQAGWTQSFVRSLAVPPRRLMAALQTAFSPATRSPMHADVRGEAGDATPLVPAGRPAAASADPAIGFRLLRHAMSEPAHALLRGVDQQATHDAQAAADVEQQL